MKKVDLQTMRHSCEHVLAQAMVRLYPGLLMAMGPATDEGFYFDFDNKSRVSETDFQEIEKEMKKIIKENLPFKKQELTVKEARKLFKPNPYKQEWLDEIALRQGLQLSSAERPQGKKEKAVIYWTGKEFVDLCSGPHLKSTGQIGPFKLLSIAGAYWRGDEKNPMLTRIYGTCFSTQKQLGEYLKTQKEAKKRDHRQLGKKLDLFSQHKMIGAGLILWHPKLSVVREEIELYWRSEHRKRGYQYVYTPHIGKETLWETSGHTGFYKDLMYPPLKDMRNDVYYVKPMNCPFHMLIYKSKPRSYRDLPMRLAELGTVYRYELEGVRHGIMRPRGFTQDDAHIICTEEQLVSELEAVLDFAIDINEVFGFKKLHYELSIRDPKNKEKYIGEDKNWKIAEETLRKILNKRKIKYNVGIGEAKFYGPAIDLKVEDSLGRLWQGTTIQFDFNLAQKFNLTYIGKDGKEHTPYMIHRTLLGSLERFIGCLIEQYAGAFPVWLSPVQVVIIPIATRHLRYALSISRKLKAENIRTEVDNNPETVQAKIRNAELQKVPYMLVVGDKEVKKKTVSVRQQGEKDLKQMRLDKFLAKIKKEVERKK